MHYEDFYCISISSSQCPKEVICMFKDFRQVVGCISLVVGSIGLIDTRSSRVIINGRILGNSGRVIHFLKLRNGSQIMRG